MRVPMRLAMHLLPELVSTDLGAAMRHFRRNLALQLLALLLLLTAYAAGVVATGIHVAALAGAAAAAWAIAAFALATAAILLATVVLLKRRDRRKRAESEAGRKAAATAALAVLPGLARNRSLPLLIAAGVAGYAALHLVRPAGRVEDSD